MASREASPGRVASLELLRGLVMVVMAIEHARDFVHSAALDLLPESRARVPTRERRTRGGA